MRRSAAEEKPKFKNVQKPTVISNKWFIGNIDKTVTCLFGKITSNGSFNISNWFIIFLNVISTPFGAPVVPDV